MKWRDWADLFAKAVIVLNGLIVAAIFGWWFL